MKHYLKTLLIFYIFSISMNAQNSTSSKKIGKFGLSYSSFGDFIIDEKDDIVGSASFDAEHFFTLGLSYLKPVNNWLEFETGIEYSKFSAKINPNLPPDMDMEPYSINFSLLNVPLTLRANFLKFFFVNGGAFFDFDLNMHNSIDSQTGLGLMAGLGIKYDFKFGGSVYINPYSKFHSLLKFSNSESNHRIYENGVRLGITYNFK